jgi:glycosyltransferase involved in cell wall biosynthesis
VASDHDHSVPCRRPRVLFLNRSYWPDAEATGQLLTELCEDLAPTFDVMVVAGQPNQNPSGVKFRRAGWEIRNGVSVRRVWHSRFPKSFLPGRVLNLLSYLAAALVAALFVPRPDLIIVETDPPLLCLIAAFLRRWHRAKLVVYLHDIYPDIAVALGKIPDGRLTRWLRQLMFGTYRRADRVVVLSRDMRDLLIAAGVAAQQVDCIPNWIDTELIVPRQDCNAFRQRHGLDGQFVVMYSGNLGLCQRLEDVLEAARQLLDRTDILFLLVGAGALKSRLETLARDWHLSNVRFLPYQPKGELSESLSAADLHLVPLDPRVSSCLMPSKLYGVLAAGSPLLAVAPEDCELAELTRREGVGLVVPPGKPDALAEAISWSADHREDLQDMGIAARKLAEQQYDRALGTGKFAKLLAAVYSGKPAAPTPEPETVEARGLRAPAIPKN